MVFKLSLNNMGVHDNEKNSKRQQFRKHFIHSMIYLSLYYYKYNRMHLNNMNNYNTVVPLISGQISDDLIW